MIWKVSIEQATPFIRRAYIMKGTFTGSDAKYFGMSHWFSFNWLNFELQIWKSA